MRICIVYDCLYPHTVGGAERWYRNVSERLGRDGHEVTYLTLRQWDRGAAPEVPGVRVVSAGPRLSLYTDSGRRRILPPLVFGAGVLWHLLRRGRSYDVVHTASFPYFSLLAAGLLRRQGRYALLVDWHELWSREYWREYLGAAGHIGWLVQLAGVRLRQRAFCFAQLTAGRLRAEGVGGPVTVLEGEYAGPTDPPPSVPTQPEVVFAGRHIPEKRVPALVPAVERARERLPGLRATILGDGPERQEVIAAVRALGLDGVVDVPGFVAAEEVDDALRRALCLVLPSSREGYGMVVIEAAAAGTPSVVCHAPDNAAVELVAPGVNGFVADDASPEALAAAIIAVQEGGPDLRASTRAWFESNLDRLSLDRSLDRVAAAYGGDDPAPNARR